MLISVIIPFYKDIKLINRAVSSVAAQRVDNRREISFEVIIGNDGPYGDAEILAAIDSRHLSFTKVVQNSEPHGPGGARNACLRYTRGDLVAFLDADDYWTAEKISLQLERIDRGATFVATGYSFEGSSLCITPPLAVVTPIDVFLRLGIGTSTVLVTRRLCHGQFFRSLRFAQDIDYWHLLSKSAYFRYDAVLSPCVVYSPSGSTRNKLTQLRAFMHVLALNQVPLLQRIPIISRYSLRGILNHYLRRNGG